MNKRNLFFIFLFSIILLIPNSKVLAYDGQQYVDSNGVVYREYGGNYTVTGYNGTNNEVIIPKVVNGKIVNAISDNAFYDKTSIISISLPEEMISIGNYAFARCTSLTNITIPKTVTSIGNAAFSGCSNLTNVNMPEIVTSIGYSAFESCSSLTSIILPKGVISIGNYAFSDCSNLTNITIPETVTNIGDYAFSSCSSLTNITIPETVTSLGGATFNNCSSLISITIPKGVTSIDYNTFEGCSNLTNITIPETVTSIGNAAFLGCSSLANITIPGGVTSISNNVFDGCSSLTNITIPEGVTSIESATFYECSSLKSITIPETVTSIGTSAFLGCSSLTNINIPKNVTSIGIAAFLECSNLASITIPEGVTSINASTFSRCSNLTSITIPYGVVNIDEYAFSGCYILKIFGYTNSYAQTFATTQGYPFESLSDISNSIIIVNFDTQGGTAIESLQINSYGKISQPSNPTKIGYAFDGWYKDANCTLPWDFSLDEITKNTTLYARWTPNTYVVNFNSQGGSLIGSKNADYNTSITAPTKPTKVGYTFVGWYKDLNFTLPWNFESNLVKDDVTLYAKWTVNKYSVSFNSQGGNIVSNKTTNYYTTIIAPSAPTKTGYVFGGWYKEATCLNIWNFTSEKVTKNTTLYAKWIANKYTIKFDNQIGNITVKTVNYNTNVAEPSIPTRTNYKFKGWYTAPNGGTKVIFPCTVKNSATLYAQWAIIAPNNPTGLIAKPLNYNSVKLTWNAVNGASGYEVYKSASSTGTYTLLTSTINLNYTNTGLTTNSTYYYKIRAYKIVGTTKVYSGYTSVVSAKPMLSVPTNLVTKRVSSTSSKLTWNAATGASGYEVYRATSSTGRYTLLTNTTKLTYSNTRLIYKKAYYYKIRAYKIIGKTKVYSGYTTISVVK